MSPTAPERGLFGRALLAFLALPGVVAFVVPAWLAFSDGGIGIHPIGLLPFAAGIALLLWCVETFYRAGKGTLAPWDPPRHLVVTGPYRWSRNPMYVAVILILVGWAAMCSGPVLWIYGAAVSVAFHIRVVVSEEPFLARTHAAGWTNYRTHVRRWL